MAIETHSRRLAEKLPTINVLGDGALLSEEIGRDRFDLEDRLGPVYDIIRHPKTRPPMAIAIYGDWGAGKTSAMRWLHGLLNQWNASPLSAKPPQYRVRPVWFYPWKYQTKEDVWRGLVAEVILASIRCEDVTIERLKTAAKRFGMFLGKSFVHALSAIKFEVGNSKLAGGSASIDLSAVSEIVEEYQKANAPQAAFLNNFEEALREWVTSTIPSDERMCIFIDDLDRCMPEISLQVLEALKLYLNIDRLIFVLGVDESVTQQLVAQHYKKHGLGEDKSRHYLAKMFQVEVRLAPTETQIGKFLTERLQELEYWKDPHVSIVERENFEQVFMRLARSNPREVKRLINSALIASSGAVVREEVGRKSGSTFTFRERLQVHFVDVILHDRYPTLASFRIKKVGDRFFSAWSKAVQAVEARLDAEKPREVSPDDFAVSDAAALASAMQLEWAGKNRKPRKLGTLQQTDADQHIQDIPSEFREIAGKREFAEALALLADEDLAWLLRMPYPGGASSLQQTTTTTTATTTNIPVSTVVENAIPPSRGNEATSFNSARRYRVHQLAKELNIPSGEIIKKCREEEIPQHLVSNKMSTLPKGLEMSIREWFSTPVILDPNISATEPPHTA